MSVLKIEREIENKIQHIESQTKKFYHEISRIELKAEQGGLQYKDVKEIVNAAQVTLFDKQLDIKEEFKANFKDLTFHVNNIKNLFGEVDNKCEELAVDILKMSKDKEKNEQKRAFSEDQTREMIRTYCDQVMKDR